MTPTPPLPSLLEREAALYALLLGKHPEEQTALLKAVCAGDLSLQQRLEARLADPRLRPALPDPSATVPADQETIELTLPDTPDETIGETLGRYRLLEKIGEGGCGVVYVAEQTEPVRRRVALKVIKLGMDTKQVVARFEAERQALAMMDHPSIAKVLDAGVTNLGRPFFVMELVHGIRITDYCDQSHLTTKARLDLFIKVCQAIQHAHQKGIIHRDIKPSNILVTHHDGVPTPKVIDFGIAKATSGRLTDSTLYTQLHQFIGTPAYMSPEQADMRALDIDTRSDIYSLGVLLYELLTGRTPIDANELKAHGIEAIRRTICECEPARPSTRLAKLTREELTTTAKRRSAEAGKLLHQLQGDLDWIVMKCLEKDRARRYETANGLAADLQRHLRHEPVVARPASAAYRFRKAIQRNKLAFSAGGLVFIALALGVAFSSSQAIRAIRAETLARQRLNDAEAISQFLTEVFHSSNPSRDGRTITVAEALGAAAGKLDLDLLDQPLRRAKLQAALGETYHGLGLYAEAINLQQSVRTYYLNTLGLEHPDTLTAMHKLANTYSVAGRLTEALRMRTEILTLRRKVLGPAHQDTLLAMSNLAVSFADNGRLAEALQLEEEALQLRRHISAPDNPDLLAAMGNLAVSYLDFGRGKEALALFEIVLAQSIKVNGSDHPDTLTLMANLAGAYSATGRFADALKLREEALPRHRKRLGPEHADTLMVQTDLAVSYRENGRIEESLQLGQTTLDLCRRIDGPKHPDTLNAMTELAISYRVAQRIPEAIALEEEALKLKRQYLAPGHPLTRESLENLAACYHLSGRKPDAEALHQEINDLKSKTATPVAPRDPP